MKAIVAVVSTAVLLFGGERVLVWSDEFDYSGLPDPRKWDYDVGNGGWGNNEIQNYTAKRVENGRAENGSLILEARRDWFSGIEYSSARLVTRNKGDWKYGRVEVRAKVPLGQGLWPAIWMLPTDWKYGGWPKSGEIDIMESFALGGIKPNQIDGNIHTEAYNHSIGTNKGAPIKNLSTIDQNYHVYAIDWNAERIDFSVDGTVYFSFANEQRTSAEWPFDQRFHLILNIAVGGSLGLTPDPSIFPKKMIVDWVRVYQDVDRVTVAHRPIQGELRRTLTLFSENQTLTIRGASGREATVSIFLPTGKLIRRMVVSLDGSGTGEYSLKQIGSGAAIVQVDDQNGSVSVKRVILQ